MFIVTAKVSKQKTLGLLLAVLALCAALGALMLWHGRPAAAASNIRTEEERIAYLEKWGWQVSPQAVQVEELQMPDEFGGEYDKYLTLQAGQGFDLTKYAGKRIKRYTYNVLNYPSGETGVVVHLLLCKNTVIGGEVMGPGFLHGLEMPE